MEKLLILQHEESTPPALVANWAIDRGIESDIKFAPEIKNWSDLLHFNQMVILGGSMDTWQTEKYPWLNEEKTFINNFISMDKKVFGICLGCQLLSEALGGQVIENPNWEIGWLPVTTQTETIYFAQYHKYKITLPKGSENLGTSPWCDIQGFKSGSSIVATQFHPEADLDWFSGKLPEGVSANEINIQSLSQIQSNQEKYFLKAKKYFFKELDQLFINQSPKV